MPLVLLEQHGMFVLMTSIVMMAAPTAVAQDAANAPAPAAATKKDRRSCRSTMVIGSHLPSTSCHKQSEWDVIDKVNQQNAESALRGSGPAGH